MIILDPKTYKVIGNKLFYLYRVLEGWDDIWNSEIHKEVQDQHAFFITKLNKLVSISGMVYRLYKEHIYINVELI